MNESTQPATMDAPRQNDVIFTPDITKLFLLRSGDVESNPGPKRRQSSGRSQPEYAEYANDFDDVLKRIARDLVKNSAIDDLGKALGFEPADIERYIETNHRYQDVTFDGTLKMLRDWRKTQAGKEERFSLRDALNAAGLLRIADEFLTVDKHDLPCENEPLTDISIEHVANDAKRFYIETLCRIQADPLNNDTLLQFGHIFTNLTLLEEDTYSKHEKPLEYSGLLKTKVNGLLPRRFLVQAEGGAGKTTLCYKIAWDWANGIDFHQFKLVIVVLLRKAKNKTVGEVLKTYLSDSNHVTAKQLDEYILAKPQKVLLVLDGLDEFDGDFSGLQQLVQIILNRIFKSGAVLITSRRWRAFEIRSVPELKMVYALIAIKGFSADNLASYIEKFFQADTESSKELIDFIADNDVIRENMAPFPIYTAMLCIMWKEFDGERRQAMSKLKTFSQLFDEMIAFLVDHYVSKGEFHANENLRECTQTVSYQLSTIGKIAFEGLLKKRLIFPENTFQSCTESMDLGCRVGVLTREKCAIPMRDRRRSLEIEVSMVQFTHKLFQEYVSAKYLASLHGSNSSEYEKLMADIMQNAKEFRYLLYFTCAQGKNVGLDIIRRLMANKLHDDFLVDVAYDSQHVSVAKEVACHLNNTSSILRIDEDMSAHTISGHLFIMKHRNEVDELILNKSCGRSASMDLAEFMCSSPSLRYVKMGSISSRATLHDVFYSTLADMAEHCQIGNLKLGTDLRERPTASDHLAQFICKMSHLTSLEFLAIELHDNFYETAESCGTSAKIENLEIYRIDLSERPAASRQLAQFICKMSHLTSLKLDRCLLHDDFYETAESVGASTKIENLKVYRTDLSDRRAASRHLALFVSKMSHLKNLKFNLSPLHEDFYKTSKSVESPTKEDDQ